MGTVDSNGELIEEDTRLAVKVFLRGMGIVCKNAGIRG